MRQAASSLSDFSDRNLGELIHLFKKGLSTALFGQVASCLQVSESQLANIVSIPVSTLTRRKRTGKLNTVESERVYRMIRIYNRAREVLGTDEAATRWMHTKIKALGWQTPLSYADTEIGAREVEAVLGRIDHGVFS
jgi:putative toxin-antitoxin system antitoxin component (TIGR02293 family)